MDTLRNAISLEGAFDVFDPVAIYYLVAILIVYYVGKLINDWTTSYSLNAELTEHDNKAIALSFAGYLLALGIVLWSVMIQESGVAPVDSYSVFLARDVKNTIVWSAIGIGLLQLARIINDKVLLYRFSNAKELAQDQNVGTGAIQCGAYIGSALMIRAALTGDASDSFLVELVVTLVYFFIGQLAFVLFGFVYQKASSFDLHDEVERDNVAAGVGFGMTLVAVGMLLSSYWMEYDSFIGLALWFALGCVLLVGCRVFVDKVMLPGHKLDDEISKDRNWGAALVEGASAIALAMILGATF